ncbi:MAG: hypothetical protein ACTSRP_00590 [Candidatus Helarchaeota archaeon]
MTAWSPPSRLTMVLALLVMVVGILLGILGFLDILGRLPADIPIDISDYNEIFVWLSWLFCFISWIIVFIGVKFRGV